MSHEPCHDHTRATCSGFGSAQQYQGSLRYGTVARSRFGRLAARAIRCRSARWVSRRRDLAVTTLAGSAYLTLQELAAYANVSVRTLRKFLTLPPAQALPAYRPGRKVLVRRDEFDAWFAQYRTRGRPALTRNLRALGFHPEQLNGT